MSLRNLHRGMKLIVIKRQGLLIKRCRFMFFACSAIPMKLFRMERKVSNKLGNLFTVTSCLWRSLRNEEVSPVTCYRIKPFAVALPLALIIFCFSFVEHNFVINWTIISFISFASVCVCTQAPYCTQGACCWTSEWKNSFRFPWLCWLTWVPQTGNTFHSTCDPFEILLVLLWGQMTLDSARDVLAQSSEFRPTRRLEEDAEGRTGEENFSCLHWAETIQTEMFSQSLSSPPSKFRQALLRNVFKLLIMDVR